MAKRKHVVVVGGGHNGLAAAAYLARAGQSVTVLERRGVLGGAAVTEEFHPGYRNSSCSYLVGLLRPEVIRDLELNRHGLELLPVESRFMPRPDGSYLLLTGNPAHDRDQIAKFSTPDIEGMARLDALIERVADLIRPFLLAPPSQGLTGGFSIKDMILSARAGLTFLRMPKDVRHRTVQMFISSIAQIVERYIESDMIRAYYYGSTVAGTMAALDQPGSAVNLLQLSICDVAGRRGGRAFARGGMGAVSDSIAAAARDSGANLRTDAEVSRILVVDGRVKGVALSSGDVIDCELVMSSCEPKRTFLELVERQHLDPEFRGDIAGWRTESGSVRMSLALRELPDFACLPGTEQAVHHEAFTTLVPSAEAFDRAYLKAKAGDFPDDPLIDLVIPTTKDDTLAPPGHHVVSVNCQHYPYRLSGGRSWDDCREDVADQIVQTIARYAPNVPDAVVARQILTPLDLEREYGLTGGDVSHGKMDLDQMSTLRPHPKCSGYRTPIKGLYLCGAGTHPGGGVTGAPGRNAAKIVLKDL